MPNKHKLSLAILAALSSFSVSGLTQEQSQEQSQEQTQAAEEEVIEEIVVSGFRSSLIKAKDLKRDAVGSQDSILAEDIADFPDLNLAESLQRIPGVTINREAGEGRQISLRGLNADFTQVQLNGMEALGTSSSPMDSRGNNNTSRSFDFNIFASELFNQIDVKKSFSANMDEGGIGGTVGLHTAKPFDYDGYKAAISAQGGYNTLSETISPRFAGLISNTWGDFGALFSIAYSNRDTNEQGYNTYRWRPRTSQGSDLSALSQADQDKVNSGDLRFSRGSRYSLFESDQTRTGATIALQYRPSSDFSAGLDILYGELDNDRGEFHLQSRGSSSTALGCTGPSYQPEATCSQLLEIEYNAGNEVIYSKWADTALHSESRAQTANTEIQQVVANVEWDATSNLKIKGLLGSMSSEFNTASTKVYMESFANMTIDYRQDRFYGNNSYFDYDPTNINEFRYHEIDVSQSYVDNQFDIAKVDLSYVVSDTGTLDFGLSLKQFEHENNRTNKNNLLRSAWQNGDLSDVVDPNLTFVNNGHERQSWLSINVPAFMAAQSGVLTGDNDPSLTLSDTPNQIEEETLGAYLQYNFDIMMGDSDIRGNIGLRYYDTDIASSGLVNGEEHVTVDSTYDGVLPTFNLAWNITENLIWRFSASENLTRPTLGQLSVTGTVNTDPLSGSNGLIINAGNPSLKPFESTNYETALEYYFDEVGYVAFAYFRKDIDNFIANTIVQIPYGETDYPLSLLEGQFEEDGTPQTAATIYNFNQPQNLEDSEFSGWEVAFQRDFDFLPEPFNNLGLIVNYTHADGESLHKVIRDGQEVEIFRPFYGLSDSTSNFTLYYETDTWGARVSSARRSDYLQTVEVNSNDQDEAGFHGTTYWDFSAFYNVNDNLKVSLEGINLSNEREEQYSDTADRLYNTTVSGRTFYLGAAYTF